MKFVNEELNDANEILAKALELLGVGKIENWELNAIIDFLSGVPAFGDAIQLSDEGPGNPPRWTKGDIEDAKAIKRVHPYALAVERRENYANPLVLTNGRGDIKSVYPGLISSLKPGERAALQEILDAEGTLRAMNGGNDDG